jgi:UDP-2,3-diacylglucosamine pyrophosphatase LpxH
MTLWLKQRRRASPAEDESVLVISDIHLGEDVSTSGPEHLSGHIRALNKELADFIATHGKSDDGRRWHLVIDGDMFDFLKISLRPDPEQTPAAGVVRQLPNTAENVVWKLERIIEIHRPLFKQLGIFLLEGHRVTIIEGNHDGEFYFEEVRRTLRAALVKEASREHARRRTSRLFDPGTIGARVAFRTWFEARSGSFHIEHGHQYDELCSFEHPLAPLDHAAGATLATPLSHRLLPYFTDMLPDFSTHGIESWRFSHWMAWLWSKGPATAIALLRMYAIAMWELLGRAGGKRKKELAALERAHTAELRALAERTPYGLETLQRLDRLKAPPAEYSFTKMANVFCLDRFMVIGGAAGLLGAAAFTGGGAGALLGAGGLAATAAALWVLGRPRRDIDDVLRGAAANIAEATGARYVVFGHSHLPELVDLSKQFGVGKLSGGAWYINSGSWVTREILAGESGKGMTYVEINGGGAALKRWRGAGQTPAVIAST